MHAYAWGRDPSPGIAGHPLAEPPRPDPHLLHLGGCTGLSSMPLPRTLPCPGLPSACPIHVAVVAILDVERGPVQESHIHSLVNVLRFCQLEAPPPPPGVSPKDWTMVSAEAQVGVPLSMHAAPLARQHAHEA